jgi:PAS domain S-box-containing protein
MWIFDVETLAILEVNDAARVRYGYSRAEFLRLTIRDIRPADDIHALEAHQRNFEGTLDAAGIWRHLTRTGELLHVEVRSHTLTHAGRAAELVVARDVSRLVALEQERSDLLARERAARAEAEAGMRITRFASTLARVGDWRVDAGSDRVSWSEQVCAIHEIAAPYSPTIEEGIRYYAEEYQERVRRAFQACYAEGTPFDQVVQILTVSGRRKWVRIIGEALRDERGRITAVAGAFMDLTEVMDARARSEQLRERLERTLNSISDAFFTLDRDWRFTFVNPEFSRVIPSDRDALLGQDVWEAFPEARGTRFQSEYEQAVVTGVARSFVEYFAPVGKWLRVNAYPTESGLAVYFQDVTRERRREERLMLLETAVQRINDFILITEAESVDAPDGPRIVFANDAFCRRTGFTEEEVLGATPRMLQGAGTDRAELDRIREALRDWQPVRAELINYARDGSPFWLEIDIVPVADEDGRYTHWVAVERDVTGRKRTEEVLRRSNERFELVSRATNDVIWDWDFLDDTVWWNDSMEEVFGHDRDSIDSGPESWTRFIHPEDHDRVLGSIQAAIDGNDESWQEEYQFLRGDGTAAVVVDRGFLIRDEAGRAVRMLGSMLDVTARRELDERLRQSQKLEAVGQLTGGVAHDFNNLLTVILGNAELLEEALAGDEALRDLTETMVTAAQRGAELTNRLLAFARRQPLAPKVVDVHQQIAGMDNLLRRTLPEEIDIEVVRGGGLWRAVVDPGQLEVALLNLAINARDAMPDGGLLTIETANAFLDDAYASLHDEVTAGRYVAVSITDTGVGMSPDVLARAFDPFFTTKEVGKGTGLGLSMIYGFVKQSGGHARIYSEPGEGTTVRLYLPRSEASRAEPVPRPVSRPLEGGSEHVLVVEDDPLVREHLVGQLERLGYRVQHVEAAARALELLNLHDDVALLLTDVVLPGGMNGRELARLALKRRPGLRVLFTSGYTENAIVHQGRLDAGVELLGKPYTRLELAAKVRKVLDGG